MGYPFGTRFYVSSIHSILSLELFVSLVFTDMLPFSPLVEPEVVSGPSGARSMMPTCKLCCLRFHTQADLDAHRLTDGHFVEAISMCWKAEWYICKRCNVLVRGSLQHHTQSHDHEMRLPRQRPNIGTLDALLHWHGIRLCTAPGVEMITHEIWTCVNWELTQRLYADMHRSLRLYNPDIFSAAVPEGKNEQDEKEPPPYAPPGDLALAPSTISAAEALALAAGGGESPPDEPFYSPLPSDEEAEMPLPLPPRRVAVDDFDHEEGQRLHEALMAAASHPPGEPPIYALTDPQHHLQVDSPIYSSDSDADAPEPPNYQSQQ